MPEIARPLLRRLTDPTPNSQAKIYSADGQVIADSRVREGAGGAINTQPLPPAADRGPFQGTVEAIYDRLLSALPHGPKPPRCRHGALGRRAGLAAGREGGAAAVNSSDNGRETPPYIRRTADNRLLVTVAEPITRNRHTVGIVQLTRDAREVDDSLVAIRMSILGLFVIALVLTVMLSWYLSLTIARPILRLSQAARDMREGHGRAGAVPLPLLRRSDEVGELASRAARQFEGAVVPHGRHRTLRGRCGARDQEPAQLHPQCHRDAAPGGGRRRRSGACWRSSPRT